MPITEQELRDKLNRAWDEVLKPLHEQLDAVSEDSDGAVLYTVRDELEHIVKQALARGVELAVEARSLGMDVDKLRDIIRLH